MKYPPAFAFLGCVLAAPLPAQPAAQPNILMIVADDLGWSDVGWEGARLMPTPHLSRLAQEGVICSQFYATPTCAPSRATIMTGQSGPRHGIYAVDAFARTPDAMRKKIGIPSRKELAPGAVTIATVLREAGYDTASIGKWHLGSQPATLPTAQGFALNIGGNGAGKPDSYFAPYRNLPLQAKVPGEYLTTRLTDEACAYLATPRAKPFFLYFAFYAPHVPLHVPQAYLPTGTGTPPAADEPVPPYVGMVAHLDDCVARLMASLPPPSAGRDTLVIFISDNGGQLMVTSNRPLRGQKGNLYEGGIRVPAFIWDPARIKAGRTESTPLCVQDLLPTLAQVGGGRIPAGHPLDGENIWPLLTEGRALRRDALFWHLPNYSGADDYNARLWQPPASAVRMGDWKLIENLEDGTCELYNLAKDAGETNDCAAREPKKFQALRQRLKTWQKEIGAPMPTQDNPAYRPSTRAHLPPANVRLPDEWKEQVRVQ